MFRVLTVAREFGSGGGDIARRIAEELGWGLLDSAFISETARRSGLDPELVQACDERRDSWIHRVSKRALWRGAFEGVPAVSDRDFFDGEAMLALTSELIGQAADAGNCVIVGRGAQCILQNRKDAFHVFVYAPLGKRIRRVRERLHEKLKPDTDVEALIKEMDKARCEYVQQNFKCKWTDPHLYNMMICSSIGDEAVASTILQATGLRAAVTR